MKVQLLHKQLVSALAIIAVLSPASGRTHAQHASVPAAVGQMPAEVSVLDLFKAYNGPRNPEQLTALFSRSAADTVRQQPPVVLSDGRSAFVVAVRLQPAADEAINFSLEGATLSSVRKLKVNEWEISGVPDKGASEVYLLALSGKGVVRYPLVVVPPLPAETDLTERGFISWLGAVQSSNSAVGTDINKDGRRDYLDDYIFTANYLARQSTVGSSREARRQRALQRTLTVPKTVSAEPAPIKMGYDGILKGDP